VPDSTLPGLERRVLVGAALVVATIAAAYLDARLLLLVVAIAAGVAASALAGGYEASGLAASPVLYATGAALFPVSAYLWREPGLSAAVAGVIFLAAARWVLTRPSRAPVASISAFLLSSLYVGFCSAYVVLLGSPFGGARLIIGLLVICGAFHAGRWAGDTFLGGPALAGHLNGSPTVTGVLMGLTGALIGAVALVALARYPLSPGPVFEIGLSLGWALTLGAVAWALLRPQRFPPARSLVPGGVLGIVQGVLIAAPALFYSIRLTFR
jgi:hypothetical protein